MSTTYLPRAPKACQICRRRKVRCDVSVNGPPCRNCSVDSLECIVPQHRRGRATKRCPLPRSGTCETNITGGGRVNSVAVSHTTSASLEDDVNSWESGNLADPDSTVRRVSCDANETAIIPAYFCPLPDRWQKEDIDYARQKRSLEMPPLELRNALIRSYIKWVHWFCPLLDLGDFLAVLGEADGSSCRISLLLFNAVMFAGSAFVENHQLRSAGYSSRMSARKDFFSRAKVLYDLGYESDRLRAVQSLLLLSYWQEEHDEPMNHWYWAALACTTADSIGLFCDPQASKMPAKRKSLWKRVGWSCFLRDHVLTLGVRKVPRIKLESFHVPLLEESDFAVTVYPSWIVHMLGHCEPLTNVVLQSQLARMCIEKTKLCVMLADTFSIHYVEANPNLGLQNQVTQVLLPVTTLPEEIKSERIEEDLRTWPLSLAVDLQYRPAVEPFLGSDETIYRMHCAFLHMFFYAIVCTFYQPRTRMPAAAQAPDNCRLATHHMRYAASLITRISEDLHCMNLIKFLPSAAGTALLLAAINHLIEHKKNYQGQRPFHTRRFVDCLGYLTLLQEVHVYARFALIFLHFIAAEAGVELVSASPGGAETKRSDLSVWSFTHTPDCLKDSNVHHNVEVEVEADASKSDEFSLDSLADVITPASLTTVIEEQSQRVDLALTRSQMIGEFSENNEEVSMNMIDDHDFLSHSVWQSWVEFEQGGAAGQAFNGLVPSDSQLHSTYASAYKGLDDFAMTDTN